MVPHGVGGVNSLGQSVKDPVNSHSRTWNEDPRMMEPEAGTVGYVTAFRLTNTNPVSLQRTPD